MITLQPDERAALAALGIAPEAVVVMELGVSQLQCIGEGTDAKGQRGLVFSFVAALPADMLRPKRVVLSADGNPIGGGLPEALPLPPRVRMVCKIDALSPAYQEMARAEAAVANTPMPSVTRLALDADSEAFKQDRISEVRRLRALSPEIKSPGEAN